MEFKKRVGLKKKLAKVRNRQEAGYQRVTVRGRKRWIKSTAKKAAQ